MKTFGSVLIIIAVLGVTVALMHVTGGSKPSDVPMDTGAMHPADNTALSPDVDSTQLCYIWNTEAGDKAQLSIDIRGGSAIGEFNWLPAEKDIKTGIFEGSITPFDPAHSMRTVNAIWHAKAEGTQNNEELKIILGDTTASPGFGAMKDRGDGTYVYSDPNKVDYSLNLSQTDCGDNAMD